MTDTLISRTVKPMGTRAKLKRLHARLSLVVFAAGLIVTVANPADRCVVAPGSVSSDFGASKRVCTREALIVTVLKKAAGLTIR